jgi:hypothetical protein
LEWDGVFAIGWGGDPQRIADTRAACPLSTEAGSGRRKVEIPAAAGPVRSDLARKWEGAGGVSLPGEQQRMADAPAVRPYLRRLKTGGERLETDGYLEEGCWSRRRAPRAMR